MAWRQNPFAEISIKQRVILIVCIVAAVTAGLSSFVSERNIARSVNTSIDFAAHEVSTAVIAHVEALKGPLVPEMRALTRSREAIQALADGDGQALALALQPTMNRLEARGVANYVGVFDAAGTARYFTGFSQAGTVTMRQLVERVLASQKPQEGFDRIGDEAVLFGYATPLIHKRRVIGVAVLAVDLRDAFSRIVTASGHISAFKVVPIDRNMGAAVWMPSYAVLESEQSGEDVVHAPSPDDIETALGHDTRGTDISVKDRTWRTLKVRFHDIGEQLLAEGAILSDVTAEVRAAGRYSLAAHVGLILAIACVLFACSYWLSRAFKPLERAIRTMMHIADDQPVKLGADYLGKGAATNEVGRITHAVEKVASVFKERRQLQKSAEYDATHDALTDIANRAHFQSNLKTYVQNALDRPDTRDGLLLMMDLDHFKTLNDTRGHHAGDLLLKELGQRMKRFARCGSVVARLGGDEFAAILPKQAYGSDHQKTVERLHKALCEEVELDGEPYVPSFSIGVTRFPDDAQTLQSLMINADMALYEAKRNGRNQWFFFDPKMREQLDHREHVKKALTYALDNNALTIVLHPICCTRTGEQRGFEVLSRLWYEGENIPPDTFIPVAEEYGLINALGRSVLEKAAQAQRTMMDQGFSPGQIAINVAPQELRDPGFFETVQDILYEYGLSPSCLCVEITETALIGRSIETVTKTLAQLKSIGVEIALDDFGTGFSSLSHLRDFRVDRIKIDKSFIQDIELDASDRALVDGLIRLADKLGLRVVAEGVETNEQLRYLRSVGCHYSQGYLHAKPLPLELAVKQLRTREQKPA